MVNSKNLERGNGFISLIVLIGIIWFVVSLFGGKSDSDSEYYSSPSTGSSYNSYYDEYNYEEYEPENPYSYGSGHSAGYEWAEENDVDSCGGNSYSFIEGCEEYLEQRDSQESNYEDY